MMEGSDFHQALFLGDGAAPKLVGAAQCGLATTSGVFTQRQTIFFFKSLLATVFSVWLPSSCTNPG